MNIVFKVSKIRKNIFTTQYYEYNSMHGISFTFYHDVHYFIIALNSSNCINCEKRRWAVHKNRLSEHDNESCKLNVIPCLCLCRLLNNIPFPVIFINMNKRMGQFFSNVKILLISNRFLRTIVLQSIYFLECV